MKQIKKLSVLLMAGVLSACGGSSSSPDAPNLCGEYDLTNCYPASASSVSSSSSSAGSDLPANDLLPLHETFSATNADQFFSEQYKPLLTQHAADASNAFYYPTAGLESGRLAIGDNKLSFGNARFTIGQRYVDQGTHINPNSLPADYRINTTTGGTADSFPTTTTWGDLDLSKNWKLSFCVVEVFSSASSNDEFQLYVDNNTTAAATSIHLAASRLVNTTVRDMTAGKRVEITAPGNIRIGGVLADIISTNPGTTSSFLQLRVPGNGVITIKDLWLGYQSDLSTEPLAADCAAGERVPTYGIQLPPTVTEAATLTSNDGQLAVDIPVVARATTLRVAHNTSNSPDGATIVELTPEELTARRVVITGLENGTTYYVFYQAENNGGLSEWSPVVEGVPEIPATPPATPADLTVYADDTRALVTWSAVAGAVNYTLAINTVNSPDGAELITDVENPFYRAKNLINGTNYYFFVRATNAAGNSDYSAIAVGAMPQVSPYIYEANLAVTKDQFFGLTGVPAVQTIAADSEQSIHFIAGGSSAIELTEAGLKLPSARFVIGQMLNNDGALTPTSASVLEGGTLDLSGNYRLSITIASAPAAGNFQVYVDNNTTSVANSIHTSNRSRLVNMPAADIADGQIITVDMVDETHVGTANSLIQVRTDSGTSPDGVVISAIRIESLGGVPNPGSSSSASSEASSSSSAISSSSPSSSSSVSSVPASSSESSASSSSDAGGGSSSSAASVGNYAWAFDTAAYSSAGTTLFTAAYNATGTNNIKQLSPAINVDGLIFFNSSTSAVYRFRDVDVSGNNEVVGVWNTNGAFFTNNTTLMPDVGEALPSNVRAYIAVPVTPGVATTVTVSFRQTGENATAAKVALAGSDNLVLAVADASYEVPNAAITPISISLPATHALTDVRFLYGREGLTTGGVNITAIGRVTE